jgi:hypothetical protein
LNVSRLTEPHGTSVRVSPTAEAVTRARDSHARHQRIVRRLVQAILEMHSVGNGKGAASRQWLVGWNRTSRSA